MFTSNFYLSFVILIFTHVISTQTIRIETENRTIISSSTASTISKENTFINSTSMKNSLNQSNEIIPDAFSNMDRGTIVRGIIVLAGITCLILMYVGIKALLIRKKRQPKRYTLITDPTSMEEPLFGAQNDEEEEIEDDTLFVRK